MIYRKFGKTEVNISILGFGAMRLPIIEKNGEKHVDNDYSIEIIHKGGSLETFVNHETPNAFTFPFLSSDVTNV